MGVEKVSVSFDLELGDAIRTSAAGARQSVSAWLAEAARDRLRLEALGESIAAWEREFGALPQTAHYDLVVSRYVHIADSVEAAVQRFAAGVAPGGTLFMVGHQPVDPTAGAETAAAGHRHS